VPVLLLELGVELELEAPGVVAEVLGLVVPVALEVLPAVPDGPAGPAAPLLECHASYSCCEIFPSLSVSAELGTAPAFASSDESEPSEFLSSERKVSDEPDIALLVEPVPVAAPALVLPVLGLVVLGLVVPALVLPLPVVAPALVPPAALVLLPLVWASARAGASASATLRISVFLVISRSPVKVG
jgi:hypothetical protein